MDITVTLGSDARSWELVDLLGRPMGTIVEMASGKFQIKPEAEGLHRLSGIKRLDHPDLETALNEIEKTIRGSCRLSAIQDVNKG